jgi:glycerol-3-phosphate dehydrogenase
MDDEEGDAQKASRDYSFEVNRDKGLAPLISVFGGKITTYRKLAEAATNKLCQFFPGCGEPWTKHAALPGGDFDSQEALAARLKADFPWLSESLNRRLVRTYGTACFQFLSGHQSMDELGQHFGGTLYRAEVDYLIEQEWALTTDDILWRRTKQGLYASESDVAALNRYLAEAIPSAAPRQTASDPQVSGVGL